MLAHEDETVVGVPERYDVGTVIVGYQDGVTVLTLVGEHDIFTAGHLSALIREHADLGRGVVIVLSDAEFIDSQIVRVLFQGDIEMLHSGRRLVIQNDAEATVDRVLQLSGVRTQLLCSDTLDEAIRFAEQRYVEH